jgi:hypothetical protein
VPGHRGSTCWSALANFRGWLALAWITSEIRQARVTRNKSNSAATATVRKSHPVSAQDFFDLCIAEIAGAVLLGSARQRKLRNLVVQAISCLCRGARLPPRPRSKIAAAVGAGDGNCIDASIAVAFPLGSQ